MVGLESKVERRRAAKDDGFHLGMLMENGLHHCRAVVSFSHPNFVVFMNVFFFGGVWCSI